MPRQTGDQWKVGKGSTALSTIDVSAKGLPVYDTLPRRHRAFVETYLNCAFNASEAYRLVYPRTKPVVAGVSGCKLVNSPAIRTAIDERSKQLGATSLVSHEWIVHGLIAETRAPDAKSSDRIRVYELLARITRLLDDASPANGAVFAQLVIEARGVTAHFAVARPPNNAPRMPQDQRSPADPYSDTSPFPSVIPASPVIQPTESPLPPSPVAGIVGSSDPLPPSV